MPRRKPPTASSAKGAPIVVSAADARRLLLHAQGLADDPVGRAATPRGVVKLVEQMGFVQLDTISTVERAHHLILASRISGYRPAMLARVLENDRRLFEHWTHDASIIPLKWYAHWRPRFERVHRSGWHLKHLGNDAQRILASVLARITREGPLSSRDFEHVGERKKNSWWGWKPHKVALDYLWRAGVLHVAARRNFHKVYDLTQRVVPRHAATPPPAEADHIAWACRTALERLGTATTREIVQFWAAITQRQVVEWLKQATAAGEVIPVMIESADRSPPRPGYALADLAQRIAALPDIPSGTRLLCPFDPVLRDRARAKRLFNFDFRFEGFVPKAQRKHGYYVMAILEGDRFVGKVDPKFERSSKTLQVGRRWWEPAVKPTRKRMTAFEDGVAQLAQWIGATSIEMTPD